MSIEQWTIDASLSIREHNCEILRYASHASRFFCAFKIKRKIIVGSIINNTIVSKVEMSKRKWAAVAILAAHMLENADEDDRDDREVETKKKRIWVKKWLHHRHAQGFCAKLLVQLRDEEPALYRNFVRMTSEQFDYLLGLVKPHIQKMDTIMRTSISASDRLVLTLRYLATGDNFSDLQFIFQIPQTTISRIIPEVLDAIYKVLVKDVLKVNVCVAFTYLSFSFTHPAFLRVGTSNRRRMGGNSTAVRRKMAISKLHWRSRRQTCRHGRTAQCR